MPHPGHQTRTIARFLITTLLILLSILGFVSGLPTYPIQAPSPGPAGDSAGPNILSSQGANPQTVGATPLPNLSFPRTIVSTVDPHAATGVVESSPQNLTLYTPGVGLRLLGGAAPHDVLLGSDRQELSDWSMWSVDAHIGNAWVPLLPSSSNFTVLGTNETGTFVVRTVIVALGSLSGVMKIAYQARATGVLHWDVEFAPSTSGQYGVGFSWRNATDGVQVSAARRQARIGYVLGNYTFSWSDVPSRFNSTFTLEEKAFSLLIDIGNAATGSAVDIDPYLVSSGVGYPSGKTPQRQVFYDPGYGNYWVFYTNGSSNALAYSYSHDGMSWLKGRSLPSNWPVPSTTPTVAVQGETVLLASGTEVSVLVQTNTTLSVSLVYAIGTISQSGITWGATQTKVIVPQTCLAAQTCYFQINDVSVVYSATGLPVFSYNVSFISLNPSGCQNTLRLDYGTIDYIVETKQSCGSFESAVVGSDATGTVRVVYEEPTFPSTRLFSFWQNSGGGSGPQLLDSNAGYGDFSVVSDSSYNVHVSYRSSVDGKIDEQYLPSGSSRWAYSADIFNGPAFNVTVTADYSTNHLYGFALEGSSIIMRESAPKWNDTSPVFPIVGLNSPNYLESNYASASESSLNQIELVWAQGNSLFFASIPISTVWSPYSDPSSPWDGYGLAPYGEYFQNLGESVSASTGLLTVLQTDLNVPGRGLSLDLTRVYTEPSSILSKPLNYENYPWAPMGDGWQLNFPWLENTPGPANVHLWNGEGYRIPTSFWTGSSSTFENHQGENFLMVRNSTGIFLSSAHGDTYLFDQTHSNRLTSIIDPSRNSINFTYSGSNQIVSITDTLQRVFQFCYNGGLLASINETSGACGASSNSRGIVFKYNGPDLSTVYDPGGRATAYAYNSFGSGSAANPWLLSRIMYPTGWYTNYTYAPSPVGTDAQSYRVSRQYVGSSPSNLRIRESDYRYKNGAGDQVNNSTISTFDGLATQPASITSYVFSSLGVTWNMTDGLHNFVRGEQQRFGSHGEVLQDTILVSPTQGYTSYYRYDLWGNLIYKDQVINPSANWYHESFNAYYNDGLTLGFRAFQETFRQNNGTMADNVWLTTRGYSNQSWTVSNRAYNGTDHTGTFNSNFAWVNMTKTDVSLQFRVYIGTQFVNGGGASAGIFTRYSGTGVSKLSLDLQQLGATSNLELASDANGPVGTHATCSWTASSISGSWYTFNLTIHGSASTGWVSRDGQANGLCGPISASTAPSGTGFGLTVTGLTATYTNVTAVTVNPALTNVGFSDSFINGTVSNPNIHGLSAGMAEMQNSTGTGQPAAIETYYGYTASGGLTQSKRMYNTGTSIQWLSSTNVFDQYGNPVIETSPQGRQDFYSYNSNNNVYHYAYLTNNTQIVTSTSTRITTLYVYNLTTGNIIQITDPNGNVTNYQNDNLGRTTRVTYPANLGYVTYSYNDLGNYVNVTNEDGLTTSQVYDGLGRLSTTERFSGGKFYSNTTAIYNWMNEAVNQTDPLGRTTTSRYDAIGRLTVIIGPDGNRTSISYNSPQSWVVHSDQYGNLKCKVYDRLGRLLSVVEEASTSCTGIVTSYYYDELGNLVRVVNSKSQTTVYAYDDLSRLVTTTTPDGSKESYTYDNDGLVANVVDRAGVGTSYQYDSTGRVVMKTFPGPLSIYERDNYTYDRNGNLLSLSSLNATVSYSYDARNRMISESYNVNPTIVYGSGSGGGGCSPPLAKHAPLIHPCAPSTSSISSVSIPGASPGVVAQNYGVVYTYQGEELYTTSFTRTLAGSSVVFYYSYDNLGRVTSVYGGTPKYAIIYYYQNDQVKSITYGNNLLANYTYDRVSRPLTVTLTTSGAKPTTLLSLTYSYNKTGTVSGVVGQSTTNTLASVSLNESYAYDPLRRVTSASLTDGGPTTKLYYHYDNLGNILSSNMIGPSLNYTYNNLNELTSTSGGTSSTYDKDGNLFIRNQTAWPAAVYSYGWNVPGQLTSFSKNGTALAYYAYDGMGRRVESKEGSTTTFYAYLGTETLQELVVSGFYNYYVYAAGMRIASLSPGNSPAISYYLEDALGSTRLVTDSKGNVLFSGNYQPFGMDNTGSGTSTYRFTGKPVSQTTGLYYDYQRWYDPTIGRFISQDPVAGHLSDPQSLNLYVYVENAPTSYSDPTGMDACGSWRWLVSGSCFVQA